MPRRHYLALWRTTSPAELRAEFGLADTLTAILTRCVIPRDDEDRKLLDSLRGARRSRAALGLAARCASGMFSDLAMSCVLLAALDGSEIAYAILVQALDVRADTLAKEATKLSERKAWSVRREAELCRWVARKWMGGIAALRQATCWPAAGPGLEPEPAAPIPAAEHKEPTRRVVEKIGETPTDGDMSVSYKRLTDPLPLKGGNVNPERLRTQLLTEFPHLGAAIDRIAGDLILRRRAGAAWARFRPLVLVGPPGVGKTRFAKRLAERLGTGYGEVSGAGSSDDRMLRGTARGWRDAQPALPLLVMMRTGSANPVMLVDEIDKAGGSRSNGDIQETLLSMLEPETAAGWFDEALLAPADLSQISWIMTANDVATLSAPLLSRVAVVPAPPPGPEMFDQLLVAVLRSIAGDLGVAPDALPPLMPDARELLHLSFSERPDLRVIRRAVEAALGAAVQGGDGGP